MDSNVQELLEWIDSNNTGLVQALRMAAESNRASAENCQGEDEHGVARVLLDSAAGWTRMADRLTALVESVDWEKVTA